MHVVLLFYLLKPLKLSFQVDLKGGPLKLSKWWQGAYQSAEENCTIAWSSQYRTVATWSTARELAPLFMNFTTSSILKRRLLSSSNEGLSFSAPLKSTPTKMLLLTQSKYPKTSTGRHVQSCTSIQKDHTIPWERLTRKFTKCIMVDLINNYAIREIFETFSQARSSLMQLPDENDMYILMLIIHSKWYVRRLKSLMIHKLQ